jgi:hypothetical protein
VFSVEVAFGVLVIVGVLITISEVEEGFINSELVGV